MKIPDIASAASFRIDPEPDLRAEALKTAHQFEQIFVQQMLAGLRKTAEMAGGEGLFGDGPGNDTYTQWFDNHLAEYLSKNGNLGIADTLMKEFERWNQIPPEPTDDSAANHTAGTRPEGKIDVAA